MGWAARANPNVARAKAGELPPKAAPKAKRQHVGSFLELMAMASARMGFMKKREKTPEPIAKPETEKASA